MIALIALLLTVSLLPACSAAPVTYDAADAAVSASVLQAQVSEPEAITYTVTTGVWADEAGTEDGTLLASYRFQLPVLTACRPDGTAITAPLNEAEEQAVSVTDAFNEKFAKWAAAEEFPEYVAGAEEDLALRQEWGGEWNPYALELTCQIYQTDHLISIAAQYYSNTGGAHPNACLLAWNFDLETGTFFTPDQLAGSGEFQQAVSEELVRQARETAEEAEVEPEMYFWPDYEDILEDWHSYTVSFDETGMTVAFSPYELACYAAGPQVFHVTYEWLLPHLGEQGRMILGLETAE